MYLGFCYLMEIFYVYGSIKGLNVLLFYKLRFSVLFYVLSNPARSSV
jgi:hypothetical protein